MKKQDPTGRLPNLDNVGKLTGPSWDEAIAVYDEILKGGREALVKLIGAIPDFDAAETFKPRYALHGIVLYVCRPEKEKERATVVEALVSQIPERSKAVAGFLIRELQVVGGREVADALGKLLLDDELWEYAAQALQAIGVVEPFRRALPQAKGKHLLTIVRALGALRDRESIPALRAAAIEQDRDLRLTALWGLANIGDAGSVDLLIKAADAQETTERIKAASACLLLAEKLSKADALKIYNYLRDTRTESSERYLRDAAVRLAGS